MKKLTSFFLLILLCFPLFAAIKTQVEPTQVSQGQSFRIIYSYQGDATGIVPDLSPLEKNFNVLGTSKSSQVSIINGNVNTATQWVVTVMAKHSGKVTIPIIQFGQQQSNPAQIQVSIGSKTNLSMSQQTDGKQLLLTNSVDTKTPYLHAQVIYTVKLYFAAPLSNAQLEPPVVDNAMVKRIGKNKTYQTNYNGSLYQVVEQNYAIFPQRSGKLTIQPPVFKGVVRSANLNRIYDVLNDYQRPVQLTGKALTLNVKPQPLSFNGQIWLPAKQLSLTEQWQGVKKNNKVGTPITRTVSIKATGLLASQLPSLDFEDSEGASSYPEKPISDNQLINGEIEATKQFKVIYIPSKEGKITIPAVTIKWWDTQFNRERTATLPQKTIKVGNAVASNNQAATTATDATKPNINKKVNTPPQAITPTQQKNTTPTAAAGKSTGGKAWILAGLFAFAWIATMLFWFFSRKKPGSEIKMPQVTSFNKNSLKQACLKNDAKACRDALINWGKSKWPEEKIYNLASLAEKITASEFKQQLALLQAELYANKSGQWQGEALWHAWLNLKIRTIDSSKRKSALPPINP